MEFKIESSVMKYIIFVPKESGSFISYVPTSNLGSKIWHHLSKAVMVNT